MCKYIYVFYISGFFKKFPCHSKIIPVAAEGKPRQEVLAALLVEDPCTGWQVLAKSLQHRAAHQPLSFSLQPTCPGHMPTVTEMHLCGVCSTPATGQRGEHAVPRASPTLCWGPSMKEKEGGGNRGGMEQTSSGLIQIQIPKYCILYKSLKKKVGRDFKWSPGLTTKGESITPVTVQRYLCSAWL